MLVRGSTYIVESNNGTINIISSIITITFFIVASDNLRLNLLYLFYI